MWGRALPQPSAPYGSSLPVFHLYIFFPARSSGPVKRPGQTCLFDRATSCFCLLDPSTYFSTCIPSSPFSFRQVDMGHYQELLQTDQLHKEMAAKRAFLGFTEVSEAGRHRLSQRSIYLPLASQAYGCCCCIVMSALNMRWGCCEGFTHLPSLCPPLCPPCALLVPFPQATIEFPPTFKVERQDGLHYKPQRSPAWCDRVLYRANVPCKKAQVCA